MGRIPELLAKKVMERIEKGEVILRVGSGELFPENPCAYNFIESSSGLYLIEHVKAKTLSSLLFGTKSSRIPKVPNLLTLEAILSKFSWLGLRKDGRVFGGIFLALLKLSLISGSVEREVYFEVERVNPIELEKALKEGKKVAQYFEVSYLTEIEEETPKGKTSRISGKLVLV